MPRRSPLADLHEAYGRAEIERRAERVRAASRGDAAGAAVAASGAGVEWIAFGPGPSEPGGAASPGGETTSLDAAADPRPGEACRIVACFGAMEPEYAAIRRGAAIIDSCQHGTIRITGAQRLDFLQRMLTQDLRPLRGGGCASSFRLNRKGRIDADLLVVQTLEETLLDTDVFASGPTRESLDRFLFGEDVVIEDATESTARLSLHGPDAASVLAGAGMGAAAALAPGGAAVERLEGDARCVVARQDRCGVPGYELFVPVEAAAPLWLRLAERARPAGWEAFNMARIEGGTPLFRVDFGPESLPHETGVMASRVSFRKGCYLGQEIVARMESLGAPKQQVVSFRCAAAGLPIAGAQLRRPGEPMATPVGVVTSSTLSPMLGGAGIGFATVRSAFASPGTRLAVHAEGKALEVEVLGPPAGVLGSGAS